MTKAYAWLKAEAVMQSLPDELGNKVLVVLLEAFPNLRQGLIEIFSDCVTELHFPRTQASNKTGNVLQQICAAFAFRLPPLPGLGWLDQNVVSAEAIKLR